METSPSEECRWSVEKQCSLQKQLVGMWSEDVWILKNPTRGTQYFRFLLTSTSLNTELKYAYWYKFDSGQWTWKEGGNQTRIRCFLNTFVQWLNAVLTHEHISSFMERKMDYWESSLRSYLVEKKQLKLRTVGPFLRANQEYIRYQSEDRHILLLHQIYNILCEAYDDRPDTEKDIWDMRKMGYAVNLTVSVNVKWIVSQALMEN
ncbi:hypothetical protein KDH_79820 [Dictyobacter sp. S3.2.2.5]|uniref:Thiopeptide-type bacteriocin biosynthesis domain-containing protein n=1 Tax=Dictyobacter halimunensis TaxID=3026934 RepID=A0ABQ6G3R7_9CHLR|nr:hypothetical protein KDH_79820 [Dictyobacter sp. S3.2.2.5]